MRELAYHVVDVFTQTALEGNPLAVFPAASAIEGALMQRIARELNLSETSFILPPASPAAAARVRIFTPGSEMLFAGHPTVGTAYVMRELGMVARDAERFVLEEKIGPVPVRVEGDRDPLIWLQTPPISRGAEFDRGRCAAVLGLSESDLLPGVPCRLLSAGNPNVYVPLRNPAAVDAIELDAARLRELLSAHPVPACLFAFAPTPQGAYSRMFAPELGVIEDPATGSATGPLAAFMIEHGLAPAHDGARFISEQGTKMLRRSILHVQLRGERGAQAIEVGGHVTPVARATMILDA